MTGINLDKKQFRYYLLYKPFGYICQFGPLLNKNTLADVGHVFPKDVYPVGRLDENSEGLLLLTNDASLNQKLLHPSQKLPKTYWAQVEGTFTEKAAEELAKGVTIKIKDKLHTTAPAIIKLIDTPNELPLRHPPIRYRDDIPTSWVEIAITEGKNRQVRKMTAKVGFPTLRLIRIKFGPFMLPEFISGGVWEL